MWGPNLLGTKFLGGQISWRPNFFEIKKARGPFQLQPIYRVIWITEFWGEVGFVISRTKTLQSILQLSCCASIVIVVLRLLEIS